MTITLDDVSTLVQQSMFEATIMAMLHVVGCVILADKSHDYIDARYMWLFNNCNHVIWEWGVMH